LYLGKTAVSQEPKQDADAMERQYKTCAKHYIPAEKCTPEIYRQLKDKDEAPLDPSVSLALKAAKGISKEAQKSGQHADHDCIRYPAGRRLLGN
jgi:hypothetical protein